MELRGRVVRKPFGGATKSAHEAVVLVTAEGEYLLRRAGGNPFRDPALDALVGQDGIATGDLHGYTFLLTAWRAPEAP